MPAERRLLLVGAGHAHLHLLKNASRLAHVGYQVTLVAPRWFDYSGTASATAVSGRDHAEGRIDVAALTRGRLDHLEALVSDFDLTARTVGTDRETTLAWDVVSFNIGSVATVPAGLTVSDSVVPIKPLSSLATLRDRLREPPPGRGHHVTVVGGGASGVELAAHLAARQDVDRVRLFEAGPRLAPSLPPGAAGRLATWLTRRGVEIRTGVSVCEVDDDRVVLADGSALSHDIAVLATGLGAPPLATRADLGGPGGIPVRATLQHRHHDDVYAAGDCADFLPERLDRIGVHGVRQGPVLLAALEARAEGAAAPTYRPARRALSILDLGSGTALAARGRWWWLGGSSLVRKRWIDRRWIAGATATPPEPGAACGQP